MRKNVLLIINIIVVLTLTLSAMQLLFNGFAAMRLSPESVSRETAPNIIGGGSSSGDEEKHFETGISIPLWLMILIAINDLITMVLIVIFFILPQPEIRGSTISEAEVARRRRSAFATLVLLLLPLLSLFFLPKFVSGYLGENKLSAEQINSMSDGTGGQTPGGQEGETEPTGNEKTQTDLLNPSPSPDIGATCQQCVRLPHTPVFSVSGAALTAYLRTGTGDVYSNSIWKQNDPLSINYQPPAVISNLVKTWLKNPPAGLPGEQLNPNLLSQPDQQASLVFTNNLVVKPVAPAQFFPSGALPTSLFLQDISIPGKFNPFSVTFASDASVPDYSWKSLVNFYSTTELNSGIYANDPTYTQLPAGLPARIRELAFKITAGINNPYQKAQAISDYLRTHYEYRFADEDPMANTKPALQDPVDWFLFDHKMGTCGNFSSAFVILARSVGIPARVVSGWAIKQQEEEQIVYGNQAHQWAEVAFLNLGWVTFEPTAGSSSSQHWIETETEITSMPARVNKSQPLMLYGTVTAENRSPTDGIEVEIFINETKEPGGTLIGQGVVKDNTFSIQCHIPPGTEVGDYQVIAHAVGNKYFEESWSDPALQVFTNTKITLQPEQETEVDIVTTMTGTILDETGLPVSDQTITISISDNNKIGETKSDENGKFAFAHIFKDTGDYKINFDFAGTDYYLNSHATAILRVVMPTTMTLQAPAVGFVTKPVTISGKLINSRGEGLINRQVNIKIDSLDDIHLSTDDKGLFSFDHTFNQTGSYTISAEFPGYQFETKSEASATISIETVAILVSTSETLVRNETASLEGTIGTSENIQLEGLLVTMNLDGVSIAQTPTDKDGAFKTSFTPAPEIGLGRHELTYAVTALSASVQKTVYIKSRMNMILSAPKFSWHGKKAQVVVTLTDDEDKPVEGLKVALTPWNVDTMTDDEGKSIFKVIIPQDYKESLFDLSANSEETDKYLAASASHQIRLISLLLIMLVLALLLVIVGLVVFFVIRRRHKRALLKTAILPVVETETKQMTEPAVENQPETSPKIDIVFPQIESSLPDVWGENEPLQVFLCTLNRQGQAIPEKKLKISTGTGEPKSGATDLAGQLSISQTFTQKGTFQIKAETSQEELPLALASTRQVRVVDYREEVVALFNSLTDWLRSQGITLPPNNTPRDIQHSLVKKMGRTMEQRAEIAVACFEEANYSRHPIQRKHYIDIYNATKQIQEAPLNG
jgi:transglutaminase-like putative cysteine protease